MLCGIKIIGFILFLLGIGMFLGLIVPCSALLLSIVLTGIGAFIILK